MTLVTLIVGQDAAAREVAIAKALASELAYDAVALILEGAPPNIAVEFGSSVQAIRIAPGCPCCYGKLTMQVTLNRLLQRRPDRLYISLAYDTHIEQFRDFLTQPPYVERLDLTNDIRLPDVT